MYFREKKKPIEKKLLENLILLSNMSYIFFENAKKVSSTLTLNCLYHKVSFVVIITFFKKFFKLIGRAKYRL